MLWLVLTFIAGICLGWMLCYGAIKALAIVESALDSIGRGARYYDKY